MMHYVSFLQTRPEQNWHSWWHCSCRSSKAKHFVGKFEVSFYNMETQNRLLCEETNSKVNFILVCSIRGNAIGVPGAIAFSEALKQNTSLTNLL